MLILLSSRDKRSLFGRLGREKVKQYGSLDVMVTGYQDLIHQVYGQKCLPDSCSADSTKQANLTRTKQKDEPIQPSEHLTIS